MPQEADEIYAFFSTVVSTQTLLKSEVTRINQRIDEICIQLREKIDDQSQDTKASIETLTNNVQVLQNAVNGMTTQLALLQHASPNTQIESLKLSQSQQQSQMDIWKGQFSVLVGLIGLVGVGGLGTAIMAFSKASGK